MRLEDQMGGINERIDSEVEVIYPPTSTLRRET